MNAVRTIASRRRIAAPLCAVVAVLSALGSAATRAADPVRVQVLWSSASPTIWQGTIASDEASISDFRPLGVSPDEPIVFRVDGRRIETLPGLARRSDGCEFLVDADANLVVEMAPVGATGEEALAAEIPVAELVEQLDGMSIDGGESSLTIRRAPQDRLNVEPLEPKAIYDAGAVIAFASRHRVEAATSLLLDWKASLISLRDGAVVWSEDRTTEPQGEGSESLLEWEVPLPETEGVYRLAIEAFPRKFGSRWYRGQAMLSGSYDLVALAEAPPVAASDGAPALVIRPGDRSWRERVSSVSPVRWFGFSGEKAPGDEGEASAEQQGERSWLVLEPGAVRSFPLPANPARKGRAVEIDVASGEPGTIEVACGPGISGSGMSAELQADSWRVAFVIPDLPAPAPASSPVETLRVLLPVAVEEGTLRVRAADPKRPVRLAEIRVVDEALVSVIATERELASSSASRRATLLIEDLNWPSRLSDGAVPANLSPRRSMRLRWYEATLRLARYAKAEGYDTVCLPAIAEGGTLFPVPDASPRLIEGAGVAPSDVGPPIDALEILLAVFDRERIDVTLAYAPAEDEAFDPMILSLRWQGLLDRGARHSSFHGCVLRLPESRFDAHVSAQEASSEDFQAFERDLGLTLPTDPALRESFLSRNGALWREWQAVQAAEDLEELRLAAEARKAALAIAIGSGANSLDGDEPPASLSILEQSGWTLWRRGDIHPTAPVAIATRSVRFAVPAPAFDAAPPALWLRRASPEDAASGAFAARVDSASERGLMHEFALRDSCGSIESDRTFAPTIDPELARLRQTLSSLPTKTSAPASRRTPLGDEPLRVRAVRSEAGLFVSATNLAPWPIRAAIEFGAGEVGTMRSLTDRSLAPPASTGGVRVWTIDLAPYDIAASRFEGGAAEVADWKLIEPPPPGIEPATVRAAIDDLSRRLTVASDPAARPSLFRDSFDRPSIESAGWRIAQTESAKLRSGSGQGSEDRLIGIAPGGGSLRLTTPALSAPTTRSATVSIVARVDSSSSETPSVRLVALSGAPSVTTHISARVDLAASAPTGRLSHELEWRQIYVPIENLPEAFWQDWTVTLEVVGDGKALIDEFAILDGYPSPERLSAWRKQLAIAEYALREKRLFAAYEALNSPSMRLIRGSFDLEKTAVASVSPSPVPQEIPEPEAPSPAMPPDERGMWERLRNWAPEPVFR